ncbi:hypothetical protein Pelo_7388 [Pelomyxa schiedti]|nr:hypothetical protein Pelo_7388 [Pelomyxa schiedti]
MGQHFSSSQCEPMIPESEAERFKRRTLESIKSLEASEGPLWARLMRACVKGDVAKVRAAAESVPVGQERQVSAKERYDNVIHVCAHLGHLAEMNVILNTWASRPPYNTMATKADAMKWLVDEASCGYTPLIIAVRNGHTDIVECLLTEWHADTMHCYKGRGAGHFFNFNVLHLCAQDNQYKCADLILSSCDTSMKISLLQGLDGGSNCYTDVMTGPPKCGKTPLETAIIGSRLDTIMAIANPKWEQLVLSAMEERKPLKLAVTSASGEPILEYLCSVFSEGLVELLVTAPDRYRTILLEHPKLSGVVNQQVPFPGGTLTLLYFAVSKKSLDMVIKLLGLGADPNVFCTLSMEWYCEQFGTMIPRVFPRGSRPMTLAVVTDQRDMVREMARCGGILTPEFCRDWSNNDPVFSLASYLDGSWEEHLKSLSVYKASLPVSPCSELCASMPLWSDYLVPAAEFIVSESITSMMIQYKAEITGVLELLDIKSLGRIQQTSKFWYQMGRSNSLWKRALLNSGMKWEKKIQDQFILSTRLLDSDSTKWKNAAFFWVARNICSACRQTYRRCDSSYCRNTHNRKHVPKHVYKELDQFLAVLLSLRKKKNEE